MKNPKEQPCADHWYHEFRVVAMPVVEDVCAALSFAQQINNLICDEGANGRSRSVIGNVAALREGLRAAHQHLDEMEACLKLIP